MKATGKQGQSLLNEQVSKVRSLLAGAESSWVDAFVILRKVENEGIWQVAQGGVSTFEEFLKANFPDAIAYRLYRKAILAIETYGDGLIRKVGVRSATAITIPALIESKSKRGMVAKALEAYHARYGIAPAPKTVWEIVRKAAPEAIPEPKPRLKTSDLAKENSLLQAEVARLQGEVTRLEKENDSLRKKLRMKPAVRTSARA